MLFSDWNRNHNRNMVIEEIVTFIQNQRIVLKEILIISDSEHSCNDRLIINGNVYFSFEEHGYMPPSDPWDFAKRLASRLNMSVENIRNLSVYSDEQIFNYRLTFRKAQGKEQKKLKRC